MVKGLFISVLALCGLVGCSTISSIEVEQDYPNQSGYQTPVKIKSAKLPASDYEKILRNEHPIDEKYHWPMQNAPELLAKYKEGEMGNAVSPDGKPVVFAVLSEYPSAGKKLCKKYFVNLQLHLACYNPHWYPVRSFEE